MKTKIISIIITILSLTINTVYNQVTCSNCGQYFACSCEPAQYCSDSSTSIPDTFLPASQNETVLQIPKMTSNIFTFDIDRQEEFLAENKANNPSYLSSAKRRTILFRCKGSLNVDYFLKSPQLINAAFIELFQYIDASSNSNKITGIYFDFSEFQFKEKRALAQFAKSVSLIVDSISVKSIQNLSLYFSFNKTLGEENRYYLYSLATMVDSVFLREQNNTVIYTKKDAKKLPFYAKVANQFYLVRFFIKGFPKIDDTGFSADAILALAHADYPDNNWESYFFALCAIAITVLILLLLYWLIPTISFYLNKNQDYLFMLLLMVLFEIILLLLAMIEAMSREDIIDFSKNKDFLLLLPLLFIFIIPAVKAFENRKTKP